MGLFDKIIGRNDQPKKLNVLDMLKMDYKNIPNETFHRGDEETNEAGESVYVYTKFLDDPEFEIFDILEVITIGEHGKNMVLRTLEAEKVPIDKVKQMVNSLHFFIGDDDNGKGRFTTLDADDYRDNTMPENFGRMWVDMKHEYGVVLSKDDFYLSLAIQGLK